MKVQSVIKLGFLAAVVAIFVFAQESEARPEGDGRPGEMTDALKYLEELDKYYSQVARPR